MTQTKTLKNVWHIESFEFVKFLKNKNHLQYFYLEKNFIKMFLSNAKYFYFDLFEGEKKKIYIRFNCINE